jgi:hypothetical protein
MAQISPTSTNSSASTSSSSLASGDQRERPSSTKPRHNSASCRSDRIPHLAMREQSCQHLNCLQKHTCNARCGHSAHSEERLRPLSSSASLGEQTHRGLVCRSTPHLPPKPKMPQPSILVRWSPAQVNRERFHERTRAANRIYFSRLSVASCSLGYSRDEQLKDFEAHLIASGAKRMPTSKAKLLIDSMRRSVPGTLPISEKKKKRTPFYHPAPSGENLSAKSASDKSLTKC